jgi:outer membrane protein OmpA-like peptidoglycan-associated protein
MPVARHDGVTRVPGGLQGPPPPARHACKAAAGLGLLAATLLLGGCSGGASLNPVDWWHGLEGGRIAEARPPPPNADAPYPNLASVPAKPPPPDQAMHARVASGLVADRSNAQYTQTSAPVHPAATPASVLAQGARPADTEQPNASLPAANAPPPPPSQAPIPQAPVAAKKAPVAPVSAAPLDPPPAAAQAPAAQAPAAQVPAAQTPPAAGADAAMPAVPDAPPKPPHIAGVAGPPDATAPTPPTLAPPAKPAPVTAPDGRAVAIPFAVGSAVLPAEALPPIKQLAARRGGASIAITGFGEATSSEPAAQAAALPLALDRARAVASELGRDAVPGTAVRIAAEPQGSGAVARLVN